MLFKMTEGPLGHVDVQYHRDNEEPIMVLRADENGRVITHTAHAEVCGMAMAAYTHWKNQGGNMSVPGVYASGGVELELCGN